MPQSKRLLPVALTLLLSLFAGVTALRAQSDRGTITGTVSDPSGAMISGATVTATQTATGVKTSTVTGAGGNFTIPLLPVGHYSLAGSQSGFKTSVQENIALDVGQTVVVPFTLQLGSVNQSVEVTGQAPQLQSATSTLSTAATAVEVESLPLFGQAEMRNPAFFMVLDSSSSGRGISNLGVGQGTFSDRTLSTTVAGSQSASTEFDVDGSRLVVESWLSSPYNMIGFPQDAVQEFTLTTIGPPAEMGRTGGGVTSFLLKSGTNRLHGSGFEYFRNDGLDANPFFVNSGAANCDNNTKACRSPLQQNEFGGTLGGPLLKNKLFFFGWYDGFRLKQAATSSLIQTPTAQEVQGDFSAFLGSCKSCAPIYDPATNAPDGRGGVTRTPFQGNVIPTNRLDQVAKTVASYLPPPSPGTTFPFNYLAPGVNGTTLNEEGLKIDYELNSRNKLRGDFEDSRSNQLNAAFPYPPPLAYAAPLLTTIPEARLSWDMIIASNIVNHMQYGFNRFTQLGSVVGNIPGGWPAKIGLTGVSADGALPQFNIPGIQTFGPAGGDQATGPAQQGGVFDETLSWVKGKHSLKFGMEYLRGNFNNITLIRDTGDFNFAATETGLPDNASGAQTGIAFASFMLGQVDNGQVYNYNAQDYERSGYYSGFAQDDFKVSHKLTLNLGLRYDLYLPTVNAHNTMSWMTPTAQNPDAGNLPGVYQFASASRRSPLPAYTRAFGPRIGLAYALNDKTVIRASYSLIYGPGGYVRGNGDCCSDDFLGGYVDVNELTNPNGGINPAFVLSQGWPSSRFVNTINTSPGFDVGGYAERLDPQDAHPLYVQNRAFQIQREMGFNTLLSVAYVGNTGVHLPSRVLPANEMPPQYLSFGNLLNDPISNPATQALAPIAAMGVDPATGNKSPFPGFESVYGNGATLGQALRIFPQYNSIKRFYEGVGQSSYNSLQINANKRFSNGLTFLVSYTWSKTLTDANAAASEFSGFDQDSFNARNQRAVSLNDYPSNLVISYSYELPFGPGKRFANQTGPLGRLIGGWKFSGLQQYQSGAPQEIYEPNTLGPLEGNNDNGNGDTRPNQVAGVPVTTAAYRSGHFDPNKDLMLNPAAFSLSAPFTFGNGQEIYSNARRLPYLDEDFSLSKRTQVTEQVNVELRADFLNAFNRTVFGLGTGGDLYGSVLSTSTVGSPGFGTLSGQSNYSREIQFGLKINF